MVESLKLHGQVIISTLVLQLKTKDSIASRVDILLVSKDKSRIINIELNPKLKKTTNNKNLSYLFKLAAEYYKHNDKDKYLHDIDVIQVNLNGYYHQNKDILISKYTLYDKQDIYNDLSLFTCTSYKEMQKYIKDNKERRGIMEMLRKIAIFQLMTMVNILNLFIKKLLWKQENKVSLLKKHLNYLK